jgi:hypothetical protein
VVAFRDFERFGSQSEKTHLKADTVRCGRSLKRTILTRRRASRGTAKATIGPRGLGMPHLIRANPLNVLVALADPDLDVAQIVPALKPHYALVCSTPAQAVEAARQFEPDIVFIDCRVPDPMGLIRRVLQAASSRNIVFVAMHGGTGPGPAGFQYSLPLPATASDLESLLWQIGRGRAAGATRVAQPGTGMIG